MRQDQKQLMDRLRRAQETRRSPDATEPLSPPSPRYDFRAHPAYGEIRLLDAVRETLGIRSPFFRRASAVDGTRVCIGGAWYDNYCSYDYLGLNQDQRIADAVAEAARQWGVSATASRIVGGERDYHATFESALAAFLGTEAALAFVSGHATNIAILRTLVDRNDVVYVDSLAHNSLFEGVIASGAALVTFPHNDPERLGQLLEASRARHRHAIIASEGLFSMDGDLACLDALIALKDRYDAWLLMDEAHSLGVVGPTGKGIAEEAGIPIDRIDIVMGTLSKSLCASGGFVAGSEALVFLLKCKAPGFLYSVGLSAPVAAAAHAALEILAAEPERVSRLHDLGQYFRAALQEADLDCGSSDGLAVAPVIVGDSLFATRLSAQLFAEGISVAPIIAPAVPEQSARLRFFLTANHSRSQIDRVVSVLKSAAES